MTFWPGWRGKDKKEGPREKIKKKKIKKKKKKQGGRHCEFGQQIPNTKKRRKKGKMKMTNDTIQTMNQKRSSFGFAGFLQGGSDGIVATPKKITSGWSAAAGMLYCFDSTRRH